MRLALVFWLLAPMYSANAAVIRCGHLLDVQSGRMLTDQVIRVAGTRIAAASAAPSKLAPIPDEPVLDLSELTCLPGLIDAHTHLTARPADTAYEGLAISVPRSAVTGVHNAGITLRAGFTAVRNLDARGYSDVALRDGINSGEVEGPRMLVSGPALGITGGHADNNLLPYESHVALEGIADGPWAARAKVRETIKYGADVIKVMASGGVTTKGDQPGTAEYTLEELRTIVEEAHKLGRRVAAHAHGTQSIKDAIAAGVDSVEHATMIDAEGIQAAKQHNTYLVFDIYNDDYILAHGAEAGMLPESIEKERKIGKIQRENFRRAHAAGVRIAFGTDAGVYPHGDNAKQFAKMVEWGMTPLEALQSATVNGADLLGLTAQIGSLTAGHFADLVAVVADPLLHIETLESVRVVVKDGVVVCDSRDTSHGFVACWTASGASGRSGAAAN